MLRVQPLGFPFATPDPFLFCVYPNDDFPQGNPDNMFAPRRGNGADFDCACPDRDGASRDCRTASSACRTAAHGV